MVIESNMNVAMVLLVGTQANHGDVASTNTMCPQPQAYNNSNKNNIDTRPKFPTMLQEQTYFSQLLT